MPTYFLNELTRGHVTVALSGDGGDELFAGYERFAAALAIGRYLAVPAGVRSGGRELLELLPRTALRGRVGNFQRFARVAETGMPEAYLSWLSFIDEPTRQALLENPDSWAREEYAAAWRASAGADPLDRVLDLKRARAIVAGRCGRS